MRQIQQGVDTMMRTILGLLLGSLLVALVVMMSLAFGS